jgi:hypothetical protein
MFPGVDSHLTTAGRGLMVIPGTFSMTGDNRACASGPTGGFAPFYQVPNHPTRNCLGEVEPVLVNYNYPIWNFGGFNQVFVDPSKMDSSRDTGKT